MSQYPSHYLLEHGVEHGLFVFEVDGADERAAELVDVAQGHGREVHVQQGRPAITFCDMYWYVHSTYKSSILTTR